MIFDEVSKKEFGSIDYDLVNQWFNVSPEARKVWINSHIKSEVEKSGLEDRINFLNEANSKDHLTGLLNKQSFDYLGNLALREFNRGTIEKGVAIAYIDLNNFKTYNDTRGHSFGDKLLKSFANRLKEFGREEDVVARFSGDEFGILFKGIEESSILSTAERLYDELSNSYVINDEIVKVDASIGIVSAKPMVSYFELKDFADNALMFDAKYKKGTDQKPISVYDYSQPANIANLR